MNHTPTPWFEDGNGIHSKDGFGGAVAIATGLSAHQNIINAAFIVRAVNAHEALVKSLKKALDQALCDGDLCAYAWHDEAREALARRGQIMEVYIVLDDTCYPAKIDTVFAQEKDAYDYRDSMSGHRRVQLIVEKFEVVE